MPSFAGISVSVAPVESVGGVVLLEHDAGEGEAAAGVLAQRLRASRREILVCLLDIGMAD
jgi:hypothetical protein